jgi:enoyl-CoA hydratase
MVYETLILEEEESIAIIRFNRPDVLNALNNRMFLEMISVFDEIEKDVMPKVVILTGTGDKAFIAGTDINEMENISSFEAREFASLARRAIDSIDILDRPIIAAVNGFALGGGCEIAIACDIRIASEKAKLGQPEINLGIIPGSGGTQRLPRLIGSSRAKQLIFTGELVDVKPPLKSAWWIRSFPMIN